MKVNIIYDDNEDDPWIKFHEFILLCGRMGIHAMKHLKSVKDRLIHFFIDKLKFSKVIMGRKFEFVELWEQVKRDRLEESSEDEAIWEEEEEEDEYEDEDEEWAMGEDGIRYPKRFGSYEKDVL